MGPWLVASAGCPLGLGSDDDAGTAASGVASFGPGTDSSETDDPGTDDPGTDSAGTGNSGNTQGVTSDADGTSAGPGDGTQSDDGETGEPLPPGDTCAGYATRYWDCCKPHCSWSGNVDPAIGVLGSCNQADDPIGPDAPSSCSEPGANSGHTCYSLTPWEVNADLAYGFAAVPSDGDICGRCYRLDFDGTSHNAGDDPGSAALGGKTMIVQAINIGYDVAGGQFDILIPGGGVGAFDACSAQWGAGSGQLGATYGGLLTACKQDMGGAGHEAIKGCVLDRCSAIFSGKSDLMDGCQWFTDWFEAADNPALQWGEVECPGSIIAASGMDRTSLGDIQSCSGGGGGGDCEGGCDCSWTNGGANCGMSDGSCCWEFCCG